MGTKRASPGDSRPKPPVDAEQLAQLEALKKDNLRIQLQLSFDQLKKLVPHYEKRRGQLKKIPQFWFAALSNNTDFALQWLTHPEDVEALKHLEDIWIARHEPDPRAFTLEMHFKENPYFKNKVLTKEYKLKKPWSGAQTDGIYDEMLDASFDPSADLESGTCKIEWKGEDKDIVTKYPRKDDPDDEELDADFGSFFHLFEMPEDKYSTGHLLAEEFFPSAIPYFLNEVALDEYLDSDSEDEESGDSAEEEIDLERPKKRARKY